jgi:hypothetical protein
MTADPAVAVVVFMLQSCRRRWLPSIGISPDSPLVCIPEDVRVIPDCSRVEDAALAGPGTTRPQQAPPRTPPARPIGEVPPPTNTHPHTSQHPSHRHPQCRHLPLTSES